MPQRTRAIEAFQQDPPTTVFMLTLRSAACGINLTAASHIFLLEPCMNPAVEAQVGGSCVCIGGGVTGEVEGPGGQCYVDMGLSSFCWVGDQQPKSL